MTNPTDRFLLDLVDARVAVSQTRLMFDEVGRQLQKAGCPVNEIELVSLRLMDVEMMLLRLSDDAREVTFVQPPSPPEQVPAGDSVH